MAIKNNINRISNAVNFAGVAIDGFNWYAYHSRNKKLLYASMAISTLGATLDFYTALKSPKKFAKVFSTFTFASTILTTAKRIKSLRND
jgi:3-methyladenine DNA glycosylase Tag